MAASATIPSQQAAENQAPSKVVYRVKRGDTLASIARVFQTTVASLKKWNSLHTNSLKVGQRLTIVTTTGALATH